MGLWSRFRRTLRDNPEHLDDIQEELQFHLDMDAADGHTDQGARARLGNVTRIQEETRAMGIFEWLESAWQDARGGLRQLRKTPALTSAVVLSLTLGIGANTAIFSLIDAALLRPLPVKDPESLRVAEWVAPRFPAHITNHNGEMTPAPGGRQGSSVAAYVYRQMAREQNAFSSWIGTGAYPDNSAIASDSFPAQQITIQYVSANYFEALGVSPSLGRSFRDEEDRVGAEPVVVVSHRFYTAHSNVFGSTVRINNVSARVVGVAPAGFFGLRTGQWPDVYAPLASKVAFQTPTGAMARGEDDGNWWVRQMGRLAPGVSEKAAAEQVTALFKRLAIPQGVDPGPGWRIELTLSSGERGLNTLNATDRRALWILMLLVAVLLLIVCANVANLLLSRSVERRRESSVRLALGAARLRLFRQYLIESGVLAAIGGGAGLIAGYGIAKAIHALFQAGRDSSFAFDLHLDPRVLGYTTALSVLLALLFGLAPSFRAARADLDGSLRASGRSVAGGGSGLSAALVTVQIALCFTALVAAGLLTRSLGQLANGDMGFDRDHVAYATVRPSQAGYRPDQFGPYADRAREALSRLPGVDSVSMVAHRPLSGMGNNGLMNFQGRPLNMQDRANMNSVGDGYLETLQLPLLMGRAISSLDLRTKSGAVVVDEVFAKKYFPNENPLGKRFGMGPDDKNSLEVVGVVGNSRYNSMRDDAYPTVYDPLRLSGTINFAIRTRTGAQQLANDVRKALANLDPAVPMVDFQTQRGLIDRRLRTERMLAFLSTAFGVVALTLVAIGLAGMLSYAVARRTNEIGVRMALGAAVSDVIRLVLRDSIWMLGAGIIVGLPCAYATARALKANLFNLEPLDPITTLFATASMTLIALIAAWIPARRAARIDPMRALRDD